MVSTKSPSTSLTATCLGTSAPCPSSFSMSSYLPLTTATAVGSNRILLNPNAIVKNAAPNTNKIRTKGKGSLPGIGTVKKTMLPHLSANGLNHLSIFLSNPKSASATPTFSPAAASEAALSIAAISESVSASATAPEFVGASDCAKTELPPATNNDATIRMIEINRGRS